jgi:hypothetical protein
MKNRTLIIPDYPYITEQEFIVSSSFPELAALTDFTSRDKQKLWDIAYYQSKPLRDYMGRQIIVTSGKCGQELNAALHEKYGRKLDSEHRWQGGSAAWDFWIKPVSENDINGYTLLYDAFYWAKDNIPIGQLILKSGHIHLSLPSPRHPTPEVIVL